jgi:hypothetical protein
MIDAWMQQPSARFLAHPMFEPLRRWTGDMRREVSLEETVAAMDEAGVQRGLLCAWYGPQGALISNEEVARCVERYPDRFAGVAGVDLAAPVHALRSLRHWVKDGGFKALRIVHWLWELPPTHALCYPLYAQCVELDVPVCVQVGLTGPARGSETGRPLHVERVALDFPELTIVCGHIGYPWQQEMIAFATKFPRVYIDTSAYKAGRYPPELVEYLRAHGRRKVMFGSNYPMLTPAACLADLASLGLDAEARALFLDENARRVFAL